jgi:hypothetical protein
MSQTLTPRHAAVAAKLGGAYTAAGARLLDTTLNKIMVYL